MRRLLALLPALFACAAFAQALPPPARDADELISRARASASAPRVQETARLGARLVRTGDGRSFALVWRPTSQPASPPAGWIVTLHGSGSWAYDEIVLWQPFAAKRNLGIVALQWWFGGGQRPDDYYPPHVIRRELHAVLAEVGATPKNTLLHGFSRGSANLYALVALDGSQPQRLFQQIIANAGGASADFPPNRDIEAGRFSTAPFAGTRWWLWCGGNDPNPDRDGCPAMRRTRDWLQRLGGEAELTEDAAGSHGGFHRRSQNVETGLDWFARRR